MFMWRHCNVKQVPLIAVTNLVLIQGSQSGSKAIPLETYTGLLSHAAITPLPELGNPAEGYKYFINLMA